MTELPKNIKASKVKLALAILRNNEGFKIKAGLIIKYSPNCIEDIKAYARTLEYLGPQNNLQEVRKDKIYSLTMDISPSLEGSELVKKLEDSTLQRTNKNNLYDLFNFLIDPLVEDADLIKTIKKRIDQSNTPTLKALNPKKLQKIKNSLKNPYSDQDPTSPPNPTQKPRAQKDNLDLAAIIQDYKVYSSLSPEIIETLNKTNLILWEKYRIDPKKIYSKCSENNTPLGRSIVSNILSIKEKVKISKIAMILNVTYQTAHHGRDTFSSMPIDYTQNLEKTIDYLVSASLGTRGKIKKK